MSDPRSPTPPPSGDPGKAGAPSPVERVTSAGPSAPSTSASLSATDGVREAGDEPTVGRASVPVLLIALLGALVYWGSMYILEYGGEADARVHYPYTSFKEIQ